MPIIGSKASDDTPVSKKIWAKQMACWIGAQVNLVKKVKTCPQFEVTHRKPQIQNEKKFFNLN